MSTLQDRIIEILTKAEAPVSRKELLVLGNSVGSISDALTKLRKKGIVVSPAKGMWTLTKISKGNARVSKAATALPERSQREQIADIAEQIGRLRERLSFLITSDAEK